MNATANHGKLLAEVLDEKGTPVEGFTKADCTPLSADGVDQPVDWKQNPSLGNLKGQSIRLRFHLENVRLYAFRLVA